MLDKMFTVRLHPDVEKQLSMKAEKFKITRSAYVRMIIAEALMD